MPGPKGNFVLAQLPSGSFLNRIAWALMTLVDVTVNRGAYADPYVVGETPDSNNSVETSTVRYEWQCPTNKTTPASADSGVESLQSQVLIKVRCRRTGTPDGALTMQATCFESDNQGGKNVSIGTAGELVDTAVIDLKTSLVLNQWATLEFVVNGDELSVDAQLNVGVEIVNDDTGGTGGGHIEIDHIAHEWYQHG